MRNRDVNDWGSTPDDFLEPAKPEEPEIIYVETTPVPPPRVPGNASPRSRLTLFLLCLTFGIIGLHDIYVGKWGGVFMKFFTANWLTLGYWIDIIKILRGTYWDCHELPVSEWRAEPEYENARTEWILRIIAIVFLIFAIVRGIKEDSENKNNVGKEQTARATVSWRC